MLHDFELDHKVTEATKNISCTKDEDAVDHSKGTRWLKKYFWSTCKNQDDQARSGRFKTVDSKAVFETKIANLLSSKSIRNCLIVSQISKKLYNFTLNLESSSFFEQDILDISFGFFGYLRGLFNAKAILVE